MKILHYVDEHNLTWSRPWLQLLQEIALDNQDCTQVVICRPGGTLGERVESLGFKVIQYRPIATWFPPLCRGFADLLDDIKPDLVHTRLSSAAAIGGYWGRKRGIPVISTVDKYPKEKYYRNANKIISCSRDIALHMKNLGVPEDRISVIANPVRVREYHREPAERLRFRRQHGVGEEKKVLLAMGRFVEWKGFDLLIRASGKLETREPFEVWIVGGGPLEEELKRMAGELPASVRSSRNVRFFEFTEDVKMFLWAADLFVQPSYHVPGSGGPEGFSLALVEAMAAGLPAVAFSCGGSTDILEDGVSGWFAEPGNVFSLTTVLENALKRVPDPALTEAAVAAAKRFDVSLLAQEHLRLYRLLSEEPQTG